MGHLTVLMGKFRDLPPWIDPLDAAVHGAKSAAGARAGRPPDCGALVSRRVTDPRELESSLAEMDRKLRELQRELELLSQRPDQEQETPPSPPSPPPSGSTAGAIEQAAARVAELGRRIDGLTDLRKELEEATTALREEQRRAASSQVPQ